MIEASTTALCTNCWVYTKTIAAGKHHPVGLYKNRIPAGPVGLPKWLRPQAFNITVASPPVITSAEKLGGTVGTYTGTVTASNGTTPNSSQGFSITIAEKASSVGGGDGALEGGFLAFTAVPVVTAPADHSA
jgi:hypothetical protein